MIDKRHLFRGFHPDEIGKTTIILNGEKIRGEWVYWNIKGELVNSETVEECPYFEYGYKKSYVHELEVIPETIGQWVIMDKRGKDLFYGDKVKITFDNREDISYEEGIICWDDCEFFVKTQNEEYALIPNRTEVIGNKWEEAK
ncbi:MAG: hypothetical protein K2M89_06260 [Clostridiales bacterium]|nr:hypothetical protein [Clostridiales bacterium]